MAVGDHSSSFKIHWEHWDTIEAFTGSNRWEIEIIRVLYRGRVTAPLNMAVGSKFKKLIAGSYFVHHSQCDLALIRLHFPSRPTQKLNLNFEGDLFCSIFHQLLRICKGFGCLWCNTYIISFSQRTTTAYGKLEVTHWKNSILSITTPTCL